MLADASLGAANRCNVNDQHEDGTNEANEGKYIIRCIGALAADEAIAKENLVVIFDENGIAPTGAPSAAARDLAQVAVVALTDHPEHY